MSAGYLVAPRGSSKNQSLGIALTRHLRGGNEPTAGTGSTYQAYRVSLFQETDVGIRYRGLDRGQVRMIGVEADAMVNDHWYIPVRGAAAYSTYLGWPAMPNCWQASACKRAWTVSTAGRHSAS